MSDVLIIGHYFVSCVVKLMTPAEESDVHVYMHCNSLLCRGFVEQICLFLSNTLSNYITYII
jgi:hypothetical protein